MTMTPHTLADLGRSLPLSALSSFLTHLPPTSATAAEVAGIDRRDAMWLDPKLQLLASIIDELRGLQWEYAQSRTKKYIPKPKPVKRPGVDTGEKRYGKDPIPVFEFEKWWEEDE